jgi:hypothetical protein
LLGLQTLGVTISIGKAIIKLVKSLTILLKRLCGIQSTEKVNPNHSKEAILVVGVDE